MQTKSKERILFHSGVRRWFAVHKRDLPWRRTNDPYHIVVSEMMLQQTQVSRVIPKYSLFIRSFPTWQALARAPLSAVLRHWSGLGYNRRAKMLRLLAQRVVKEYDGVLPSTEKELQKLPGIGVYTARAILVFAFHKRFAPADTNITRVIRRYFFGERRIAAQRLERSVQHALPSRGVFWWNHALMDFGAAVCTAQRPACAHCPLQERCAAAPHFLSGKKTMVRKPVPRVAFKDSLRYLRGRILAHVLHGPRTKVQLLRLITQETVQPTTRILRAIADLEREQLIVRSKGYIRLPR